MVDVGSSVDRREQVKDDKKFSSSAGKSLFSAEWIYDW